MAAARAEAPVVPVAPNPFRQFWDLGFRKLLPIVPPGAPLSEKSYLFKRAQAKKDPRGKVPGYRGEDGLWRSGSWMNWVATEDSLDVWHGMGAGVGIRTGDQDDGTSLVAIDADTLDLALALEIRDVIRKAFGKGPVRLGRSPKALYIIRVKGTLPYHSVEFDGKDGRERVELLTDGRQFVAHGTHPGTKKPYQWPVAVDANYDRWVAVETGDVLSILASLAQTLPGARRKTYIPRTVEIGEPIDQESLRGDLDLVTSAVRALPNTHALFPLRQDVINMGYALHAALPDHPNETHDLFHTWCEKWVGPNGETNDPAWLDAEWGTLKPPYRLGADFIYSRAERHAGWAGRWFDADAAASLPPRSGTVIEGVFPVAAPVERPKFKFISQEEAAALALTESAEPLIDGLLDQGALSVMYGDSNAGKTFIALDMAGAIATGTEWAGMATAGLGVAYIAAEGGRGILKRLAVLRQIRPTNRLHLLRSAIDLSNVNADVRPLIEDINDLPGPIGLVVIDTLSRALAGRDENSSVDMGVFVRCMDAIRAQTNAHVMIIHHTGKDAARGARGHSSLRAALDTEIEVIAEGPGAGVVQVTKQRDMEMGFETRFELRDRVAGLDSRGRIIKSAFVIIENANTPKASRAEQRRRKASATAGAAVSVLGERNSATLASCWQALAPMLRSAGVTRGGSRPIVVEAVQDLLNGGVDVQVGAERWHVSVVPGNGRTGAWIIKKDPVAHFDGRANSDHDERSAT